MLLWFSGWLLGCSEWLLGLSGLLLGCSGGLLDLANTAKYIGLIHFYKCACEGCFFFLRSFLCVCDIWMCFSACMSVTLCLCYVE